MGEDYTMKPEEVDLWNHVVDLFLQDAEVQTVELDEADVDGNKQKGFDFTDIDKATQAANVVIVAQRNFNDRLQQVTSQAIAQMSKKEERGQIEVNE